jgi:hypothetical protein
LELLIFFSFLPKSSSPSLSSFQCPVCFDIDCQTCLSPMVSLSFISTALWVRERNYLETPHVLPTGKFIVTVQDNTGQIYQDTSILALADQYPTRTLMSELRETSHDANHDGRIDTLTIKFQTCPYNPSPPAPNNADVTSIQFIYFPQVKLIVCHCPNVISPFRFFFASRSSGPDPSQ